MIWHKMTGLLRRLEVSRAVFFSVLTQGWSALAGLATVLVIVHRLTAVEQGFYYTFSSILALQVFVELGLAIVIVQVASHEWAFLKREPDGGLSGDLRALSRLASLLRFALKWYASGSLLAIVSLSIGGYCFFAAKPHPEIVWQWPWFSLCGIAGLALLMSPVFSIIEGCNQVASIYSFRFVQGVLSSLAVIISMFLGLGLFALAIAALVRFTCGLMFIAWKHRVFIRQILTTKIIQQINWRDEIWPFQWRIGISWLCGYFIFSIFTPVMFYYHGAKVAGQMGMTWILVVTIESVANAWMNTRLPQFGMLIAQRQFAELDQLFRRLFYITMGIALICCLILYTLMCWVKFNELRLGDRILPLFPASLLIGQRILNIAVNDMAFYLRAHKREVLMPLSLIWAALGGLSIWMLGAKYGATGAAAGFLGVTIIWGFPSCCYIFFRSRKLWHANVEPPAHNA
jgi:O-antigen/teichoic acid export membrane protein